MTSPTGLVDFFVLEAGDYAERLDGAIATGGLRGPDPETLARYGRALRGTATMSRFPAIAELAGAIERVGRAMHDGRLPWSPALAGAITSGVDEVKLLVRAARQWTPEHESRAQARAAELLRYVPAPVAPAAAAFTGNAAAYLGGEVAAIATGLMAYLTTGGNEGALSLVLRRARAVQGVATTKDAPPVAEVVGAVERTAAALEARRPGDRGSTATASELFSAAAVVLQRAAADLRAGRAPDVAPADMERFEAARAAADGAVPVDAVVPIGEFLAPEGVVRAAPTPPMTARSRFRAEMVSRAEHLRQLVSDVRAAPDLAGRTRSGHELERALRALERTSTSFGETGAAAYFGRMADRARTLDPQALAEIDAAGATLAGARPAAPRAPIAPPPAPRATPPATPADAAVQTAPPIAPAPPAAASPPPAPASAAPPAVPAAPAVPADDEPRTRTTPRGSGTGGRARTPSGRELQSLLKEGLAGLGGLQSGPFGDAGPRRGPGAPTPTGTPAVAVSGRAALDRAREIRDTLRRRGTPSDPLLAELFELLDRIGPAGA